MVLVLEDSESNYCTMQPLLILLLPLIDPLKLCLIGRPMALLLWMIVVLALEISENYLKRTTQEMWSGEFTGKVNFDEAAKDEN